MKAGTIEAASAPAAAPRGDGELSAAELASLLSADAAPPAEGAATTRSAANPVPGNPVPVPDGSPAPSDGVPAAELLEDSEALEVAPDLDELQQLETFIAKLDTSLPQSVRLATARAFMQALGKDAAQVIANAEERLARTRGKLTQREQELQQSITQEQALIDALQSQIETHRHRMAQLTKQLEIMQSAKTEDEGRIRELRGFLGLG